MIDIEIKNLDRIIDQVKMYTSDIKQKEQQVLDRLKSFGVTNVEVRYSAAINFDNDSTVTVSGKITDNTLIISAKGEQICFLEFGAGVYYNGTDSYPLPLPNGVVGIGQYGKGFGKRRMWGYYKNGDKNQLVRTRGTQASKAMYNTLCDICETSLDVIREVFSQ